MTKEQKIAANPELSVWVTANAGTGKTKVLTDRVLRLLLAGNDHNSILCLTYTKAAASEMYERIYDRLIKWSIMGHQELVENISELISRMPTEDEILLSRRLFAMVASGVDDISIQTIHAFCQSLLQKFPLEAGINPGFSIIEEAKSKELIEEAKSILLNNISIAEDDNNNLIEAFKYLVSVKSEYAIDDIIAAIIYNFSKIRSLLEHHGDIDSFIRHISDELDVRLDASLDDIELEILSFDRDNIKYIADILVTGGLRDKKYSQSIYSILAKKDLDIDYNEYISIFFTKKNEKRKISSLVTKKILEENPRIEDLIAFEQSRLESILEQIKSVKTFLASRNFLYIAAEIINIYSALKNNSNYIDHDDIIYYSLILLDQPDISSWILYKLNYKISHILLDESQDTSPDQWKLMTKLTEDFFSGDSINEERSPTLFIVGDEKQSIYSFQGANIESYFNELKRLKSINKNNISFNFNTVDMNLSFRSTEAVLNIVDYIFNKPEFKNAVSDNDLLIKHNIYRKNQAGLVEIWSNINDDEKKSDLWQLPKEYRQENNEEVQLAKRIADQIAVRINENRVLKSKNRPVRAGDFLILVEKRTALIHSISRFLKDKGINVAPSDRISLNSEIAIADIISLSKFLLLPQDDLSLAEALKSPLFNLSEENLFLLSYNREDKTLWHSLQFSEDFLVIEQEIKQLLADVDYISPFQLYTNILEKNLGRKKFVARLGEAVNEVINEFMAMVLDFEVNNPNSLQEFVRWFENNSDTDIKRQNDSSSDHVRIMTVHGSKGLQAPIVILADISKQDKDISPPIFDIDNKLLLWSAKSDEDSSYYKNLKQLNKQKIRDEKLRLLYVAITRAEDEFYACGLSKYKGDDSSRWYNILQNCLKDIGSEFSLEDGLKGYRYSLYDNISIEKDIIEIEENKNNIEVPQFFYEEYKSDISDNSISPSKLESDNNDNIQEINSPLYPKINIPAIRGNIIHELLHLLPKHDLNRLEESINNLLDLYVELGGLESLKEEIYQTVLNIFQNDSLAFIYDNDAYSEIPVKGYYNTKIVSGTIDRIVKLDDNNLLIIDYKTSKNPPRFSSDVDDAYIKQMALYKKVVADIFPKMNIECAILWVSSADLMYINDDLISDNNTFIKYNEQLKLSL